MLRGEWATKGQIYGPVAPWAGGGGGGGETKKKKKNSENLFFLFERPTPPRTAEAHIACWAFDGQGKI